MILILNFVEDFKVLIIIFAIIRPKKKIKVKKYSLGISRLSRSRYLSARHLHYFH